MNSKKPMRTAILITAFLSFFTGSAFAQTNYETVLKNLKFRSIGPATMGGRLDDIAVVESDTRVIYIGAAAGGLFKTVNGGITWQALFDNQPNPSIGAIAIAPSNPSIVYVGTGEANNRQSSSWGDGVYKTMDGGATGPPVNASATGFRNVTRSSRSVATTPSAILDSVAESILRLL